VIRPVVSLTPSRRNLQKARRFGVRGESLFLFFGVRTENVETPEQRVAAVEQQELQQEQDEGRSDQVLELFVELLEAEGRQVAFFHIVDRAYDFVQPDRLVGRADVGSVGRLCDLFEQGFAQFRYDHLSLVVLDELAADLDRSAFRRADADGEDADALFGGPFGRFDGAGVVPFAMVMSTMTRPAGLSPFSEKDMVASERA